jgi:uncharacterized protein YqeY
MLIEKLKARKIAAMKSKNVIEKNILNFVIGKIQTLEANQNKECNDEQIESTIRNQIINLDEELSFLQEGDERCKKLLLEKEILNEFLPIVLTQDEIEAVLLNSNGPEVEQIRDAAKDGQAIGIAIKFFKASDAKVLGDDVKAVVTKIRSEMA